LPLLTWDILTDNKNQLKCKLYAYKKPLTLFNNVSG
jgi:hypothetical protein